MKVLSLRYLEILLILTTACVTIAAAFPTWSSPLLSAALLFLACSIYLHKRIQRSIASVRQTLQDHGHGNLEPRLYLKGETGQLSALATDINRVIDVMDAFIREAKAAMQSAMAEKYYRKIQLTGLPGTYRQGAQIFNDGLEKIRENTMRSIRQAVTELDKTAKQGNEQANQLLSSTSATSASVSSVAAAMEEMNATIAEIASQIDRATSISKETFATAQHSSDQVNELFETTRQISSITAVIQNITHQINLLALNATIEAARAGDVGKGFAVVAGEVKTLADSTAKATEEIAEIIVRVSTQVGGAVEGMNTMMKMIEQMNEATLIISSAMTEQSTATQEITRAIGNASISGKELENTAKEVADQATRTWEVSKTMQSMCA
jgi:methyl-accepting chemotaxis protein